MKRTILLLALAFTACSSSSGPSASNTFNCLFQGLDDAMQTPKHTFAPTSLKVGATSLSASDGLRTVVFTWAKAVVINNYVDTGSVPPVTVTLTDSTGTYTHAITGSEPLSTGCNVIITKASSNSYGGTFTFLARNASHSNRASSWSGDFSVSF